jgi:spore photoproduct lyase
MIDLIYIEEELIGSSESERVLAKFTKARVVTCDRYTEVFNPRSQNFRLQKKKPALILARKHDNHVLPTPAGYGIGGAHNYYFSHMLNCLYDCRYCFLQGMYRSANYLLFVNYGDFQSAIVDTLEKHAGEPVYFFSGYDCDSLAMEQVTQFGQNFIPFFEEHPQAILELRTKSVSLKAFSGLEPVPNVVVAFSMTPTEVAEQHEHKAPRVAARVKAIRELASRGWKIGLRFDPIIYDANYQEDYRRLFDDVFSSIKDDAIHSVSLGPMRFPRGMYDTITKLYPREKLFAHSVSTKGRMVSYPEELEKEMMRYCEKTLSHYIAPEKFFFCLPEDPV